MAQVDFSGAVLQPNSGMKPMDVSEYLRFNYSDAIYDINGTVISTNRGKAMLVCNPNKVTFVFTGTFTASGTELYITDIWRVSNITFASGDTYSFAIDIETSITT